jgi:hypothetical protein
MPREVADLSGQRLDGVWFDIRRRCESRADFTTEILASCGALEYRILWRLKLRHGAQPNHTRLQGESL